MFKFLWDLFRREPAFTSLLDAEDARVVEYKRLGLEFAEIIFDRVIGHDVDYPWALDRLIQKEQEIAALGYRPLPICVLVRLEKVEDFYVPLRQPGEEAILFAAIWKETNTESDIFDNENLFEEEHTGSGIHLTVKPESNKIFAHEKVLLRAAYSAATSTS
jgi:hypothetical protein